MYNIVTNSLVIYEIKKSRYFKINLGISSTKDVNNERILNNADKFAYYYNINYKTTIYAQGNIGDIKFYTDLYIKDPVMAIYIGNEYEEFLINIDFNLMKEKGIDSYLGYILKTVEEEQEKRAEENKEKLNKKEEKKVGNPDIISNNPGAVKYEDIKAYIEKQNAERYKINK